MSSASSITPACHFGNKVAGFATPSAWWVTERTTGRIKVSEQLSNGYDVVVVVAAPRVSRVR